MLTHLASPLTISVFEATWSREYTQYTGGYLLMRVGKADLNKHLRPCVESECNPVIECSETGDCELLPSGPINPIPMAEAGRGFHL